MWPILYDEAEWRKNVLSLCTPQFAQYFNTASKACFSSVLPSFKKRTHGIKLPPKYTKTSLYDCLGIQMKELRSLKMS